MASLMDIIMQNQTKNTMRAGPMSNPYGAAPSFSSTGPQRTFGISAPQQNFGMSGPMAPSGLPVATPSPFQQPAMPMGEPGYSGAVGAMVPTAQEAARRTLPGRTPGFLDQLLSGPNYQSNNMPVNVQAAGPAMQGQQMPNVAINWGDSQNPADFFRADQMLQQNQQLPGFLGGF